MKKVKTILENSKDKPNEILDTLQQKLAVYSIRLRRYKDSYQRKEQNSQFEKNEKQFYNQLTKSEDIQIIPPSEEQITNFWTSIWSNEKTHNSNAEWIKTEEARQKNINNQDDRSQCYTSRNHRNHPKNA